MTLSKEVIKHTLVFFDKIPSTVKRINSKIAQI